MATVSARSSRKPARQVRGHPRDFVTHLRELAERRPQDTALIVVDERDGALAETRIAYAQLELRVRALAARLQEQFGHGERALLLLDNDDHYAVAFLACAYAGLVAVPAFPPESMRPQHLARLSGMVQDAEARCVLTSTGILAMLGQALHGMVGVQVVAVDGVPLDAAGSWREHAPAGDDIAFLQYTSGSTAKPKGVMVSHDNLMANERVMEKTLALRDDDVFVSWLPLYHDMGLIGGLLQPIHRGAPLVLMTPRFFLERPSRWLEAVSRHRATVTGGPDFSYRLCIERIKEAQVGALDLSRWRIAYTGAEPVRHDTLAEFGAYFSPAGFDEAAFRPCYGLAEATLFITGGRDGGNVTVGRFSSEGLSRGEALAVEEPAAGGGAAGCSSLVGCGCVAEGHRVRITDGATRDELPEGRIGEIWASGPSVSRGYWTNTAATQETFVDGAGGPWLRTGDLGFMREGQLYVTGRIKDLIILNGRNIWPQDLEWTAEAEIPGLRSGDVAAFSVPVEGEESVIVLVQSRSSDAEVRERLVQDVTDLLRLRHGVEAKVTLVGGHALPQTSSGKLSRSRARAGYLAAQTDKAVA